MLQVFKLIVISNASVAEYRVAKHFQLLFQVPCIICRRFTTTTLRIFYENRRYIRMMTQRNLRNNWFLFSVFIGEISLHRNGNARTITQLAGSAWTHAGLPTVITVGTASFYTDKFNSVFWSTVQNTVNASRAGQLEYNPPSLCAFHIRTVYIISVVSLYRMHKQCKAVFF